jgi:hypothetical protein
MDRFDLWGSLSTGLLSGLSRETRLSWAHVAARLPGIGEKGRAFLGLSDRLAKIETDLTQPLSSAVKGGTYKDIERLYADGMSKLLHEPLPPGEIIDGRMPKDKAFFGRPESASEEVGRLYDYFFTSLVDRGSTDTIPKLVDDVMRVAFKLLADGATSEDSTEQTPKNDAERRQVAIEKFAKKLAPELHGLALERDIVRRNANATIEQLRHDRIAEVEALPSSPEFKASDVLGKLLADRTQERIMRAAADALGEVEQSANNPDARQLVSLILSAKLRWIDDKFGQQFRADLAHLKSKYQSWADVRRALTESSIRFIDLSENLRRGELRREIVAGSVQCVIDKCGVKRVRYSPPQASGPPPDFMNWIGNGRAPGADQADRTETADKSRKVTE